MPKIPNPFDKPKGKMVKKGYAYAVRKGPKGGVDTRPTELEPKRVAPRQRMPKELAPTPPRRGIRPMPKPSRPKPKPRPMPMPRGPKGDGPKARPMPMPKGPSRNLKPKPMPYGPPKRRVPKALPSYMKPRRKG